MTSIEKFNADIIRRIGSVYPNIPFTAQEKIEDITRPAFKLILDEIKAERYTVGAVKRAYPVELVYFASDTNRPKFECLNVYESIETTLFGITENLSVAINSADAVLVIDFELTETSVVTALYEDENNVGSGEPMENYEIMEELHDGG